MKKKIDELTNQQPKDVNSPESQAFLREIHDRSVAHQAKMKKMIEEWKEEDRSQEHL